MRVTDNPYEIGMGRVVDLDAKIVETPFFDPKKDIPKGEVS